ncbi:hypothetical protein DID75_03805 [Candidatus Marinamargulisbacteria bacterium SCGC AG-410-N11]|nr:hypothetical protein DID75_03805 [Candidatus Marinamargulisbacteria bacterium SCGC AG-410-N11]
MKKILFFCSIFFFSITLNGSTNSFSASLESCQFQYEDSFRFESNQLYSKAYSKYLSNHKHLVKLIKSSDKDQIQSLMPLLISNTYRLGASVRKMTFNYMNPLYKQLDFIDNYNQCVETIIAQVMLQESINGKSELLSLLYFSRALNHITWSYKLLNAIAWKQYVVYPTNEILNMLGFAMKDFQRVCSIFDIQYSDYEFGSENGWLTNKSDQDFYSIQQDLEHLFINDNDNRMYLETLQFIYNSTDLNTISEMELSRFYNEICQTLFYFNSNKVNSILRSAKKYHSYDEIMGSKNKPLFYLFEELAMILNLK